MAKIIEYVDIPDDKVKELKTLLSKTHGNTLKNAWQLRMDESSC